MTKNAQQEVEVLVAGQWVPGWLEAWREADGRGEGFVFVEVQRGPNSSTHRAEWYDEDEIRESAHTEDL